MRVIAGVILLLCSICGTQAARNVSLAWDPAPDSRIVGYRVHFGTASATYTQELDVGNLTQALVPNLSADNTYFFAVTSYDADGLESLPSNEVISSLTLSERITPPTARLLNVSVRAFVRTNDSVMVGGFVIAGGSGKRVLLRALGPSLANAGVGNPMLDPVLELHNSAGAVIASNYGWPSNQEEVLLSGLAPSDNHESALVATLPPGAYSAVVRSASASSGVALFEVYDLDSGGVSELVNLSTRGRVELGENVMIGGFIMSGVAPAKVILRALGPSLPGIADPLLDPILELHGSGGSLIFQNDNWATDQRQQIVMSTLAPAKPSESAIFTTLQNGAYSAVVRGAANATGIALIEIYNLGPLVETGPPDDGKGTP